MGTCKVCGCKTTGKKQYCDKCKKERKRNYFNTKYQQDDKFRKNHINRVKDNHHKKEYLGELYAFSSHKRSSEEDEARVVRSMKNRTLNKRKTNFKEDSFGYRANKNYNQAKKHEEKSLENKKTCEICGGQDFEIENGYIVCTTCGLCEEVFSMSYQGKKELMWDEGLVKMREYYKKKGGRL